MTTYRLMDGADGRPGNGPSTAVSYNGNFLAGTAFEVTDDDVWFEGYWWWVCDSGQQTQAQPFALWQVDNNNNGLLVEGGTVTSGTLTSGTWNYVALPAPIQLSRDIPYVVATGYACTSGFPNTNNVFGAGDIYSAGIVNGPLTAYSDVTGSNPSPNLWAGQGLFALAYSDPTVHIPDDGYESASFWMDLQVSTAAPSSTSYRLWPSLPDPPSRIMDSALNFTLATEFILNTDCTLDKIWFYSPSEASQLPSECGIWNISSQSLVTGTDNSSPTWSGVAGSGWVYCDYTQANIVLTANTKYKVAVVNDAANPGSWNSATLDYWSTGTGGSGISSGPISAPNEADSSSPGQSSYNQGSAFTYPATYDSGGAPNYWVDVEVTPSSAPPPSPPVTTPGGFLAFFP
jgi:hypothetical protein